MDQEKLLKIREILAQLNQLIYPYQLAYVSPEHDCIILSGSDNARYMTPEQFERLLSNIQRDGFLSQLPFAIKQGEKYRIISGNHRIKAARKAKIEYVLVQYIEEEDIEKALAIQLSHNSIIGQDDFNILRRLYDQIKDLDLKKYSGIDERTLFGFEPLNLPTINESDIVFNEIRFFFTAYQLQRVDEILARLEAAVIDEKTDRVVFADFYEFIEVMTHVKEKAKIKNNSVAFLKMLDICREWLEQPEETQ